MTDNRNTILAVILSGLVLIGWQYFFNIPQMEKQRAQSQIQAELAKDCPKCTLSSVNVEVPDWQTQIASTVTAQMLQHPNTTVLFPDYAGELTYVLAGLQAAHKTDVKTYLAFGGGTPFVQLQTAQPGATIIQSDVSESPPWTGYLLFLQTARALETRRTPFSPSASSSFARSWICRVMSVPAGPPSGGLYLKPPSGGGVCDGVTTIPSARGPASAALCARIARDTAGVGV